MSVWQHLQPRIQTHWQRLLPVAGRFLRQRARAIVLAFIGIALPLSLFAALALDVRKHEPFEFDEPFLQTAHAMASPAWDQNMALASELGYLSGVVPLDAILLCLLLWRGHMRKALFFGLAVGGSALMNLLAKAVFQRDRPELWLSIAPEHTFSFPSGHAMGSATLAATLVLLLMHTHWRWPALLAGLAFTLWVGASRVYLGVHFPSDIMAGWAAALTWVCAMYLVVNPNHRRPRAPRPFSRH